MLFLRSRLSSFRLKNRASTRHEDSTFFSLPSPVLPSYAFADVLMKCNKKNANEKLFYSWRAEVAHVTSKEFFPFFSSRRRWANNRSSPSNELGWVRCLIITIELTHTHTGESSWNLFSSSIKTTFSCCLLETWWTFSFVEELKWDFNFRSFHTKELIGTIFAVALPFLFGFIFTSSCVDDDRRIVFEHVRW